MPGQQPRRDHYAVLGVPRSASAAQITSAYRKLVRSLHPDARPEDPAAAEDLADVLAAYDTLRDEGRRAAYDAGRRARPPATTRPSGTPGAPRFSASLRVGPKFTVSLRWDDRGLVGRILRQWLREMDVRLR